LGKNKVGLSEELRLGEWDENSLSWICSVENYKK
jgi:hypothetical protein